MIPKLKIVLNTLKIYINIYIYIDYLKFYLSNKIIYKKIFFIIIISL